MAAVGMMLVVEEMTAEPLVMGLICALGVATTVGLKGDSVALPDVSRLVRTV